MKYQSWNQSGQEVEGSLLQAVLRARGIDSPAEQEAFLHPEQQSFHAPFLLKDMDKAVARIHRALEQGEQIAIYGDYDVDGITSTALLTLYFRSCGAEVISYIPDRIEEGYGLNVDAVRALAEQGVKLVITVDCGITAVAEVALARELGLDVVITDHHSCKAVIPNAAAVVNPQQPDCMYPFRALAGVAVAWKLAVALAGARAQEVEEFFLPIVAIGTVADAMPLTGENRSIVARGLREINTARFPGLQQLLLEAGGADKPVTATTVGFTIAPRINAAGRMGQVSIALELLLTQDLARAKELSRALCELNAQRKTVEEDICEQCIVQADMQPLSERSALVLAARDWHQGVIGIVATRLSEKYTAPAFIISIDEEGRGKGSCRTFAGFNLFSALEQCSDLLVGFGGHQFAAGFTILEEHIPAFRQRLNQIAKQRTGDEAMTSSLDVDLMLSDFSLLSLEQVRALDALEPCGTGNPKPSFAVQSVEITSARDVGAGRHLRLRGKKGRQQLDGIFFSATCAQYQIEAGRMFDIAFAPGVNSYNGNVSVQMQVNDLRPGLTRAQQERAVFDRFFAGEPLLERERELLVPHREEFAAVWRYVSARGQVDERERDFVKNVSKMYQIGESTGRTLTALLVLEERGLLQLELSRGRVCAVALPTSEKVNLEISPVMERLRGEATAVGG